MPSSLGGIPSGPVALKGSTCVNKLYTSSTDVLKDCRSGYGLEPRSGTGESSSCVNTEAKCLFSISALSTLLEYICDSTAL